jgi:hypothetical protein
MQTQQFANGRIVFHDEHRAAWRSRQ